MLKDPLQERLKQMESDNPSSSLHSKTVLDSLLDQLYFVTRHFKDSVREYTDHQRAYDLLVDAKKEAGQIMFYRQAISSEEQAIRTENALFWKEIGLNPEYC